MNLASILRVHARSRPDHPAIEFQGDILDYLPKARSDKIDKVALQARLPERS